jgi:hypothetical protein
VVKSSSKPTEKTVKPPSTSELARERIRVTFDLLLSGKTSSSGIVTAPTLVAAHIDAVFASSNLSYRDALVVQFAFWLAVGKPVDIPLMATSKSPTYGQSNSPRQDGQIISLLV